MKDRLQRQIDQVRRQLQRAEDEVRVADAKRLTKRLHKLETEQALEKLR